MSKPAAPSVAYIGICAFGDNFLIPSLTGEKTNSGSSLTFIVSAIFEILNHLLFYIY